MSTKGKRHEVDTASENEFRRSESPTEDWGDVEEIDWQVEIIGEEVDYWGNVRYEAAWDSWQRRDGTNTTWKTEYICNDDDKTVYNWDRAQQKRRKKTAAIERGVMVNPSLDIHNNDTRLRFMAFEEKLELAKRKPCTWAKDRLKVIKEREQAEQSRKRSHSPDPEEASRRKLRSTSERLKDRGLPTPSLTPTPSMGDVVPKFSQMRPQPPRSSVSTASTSTSFPVRSARRPSSSWRTNEGTPTTQTTRSPSVSSAAFSSQEIPFEPRSVHMSQEIPFGPRSVHMSQEIPFEPRSVHMSQEIPFEPPRSVHMSQKARGKQRVILSESPSASSRSESPELAPAPRAKAKKSRRQLLSEEWTSKSDFQITFCGSGDQDDIPPLRPNFHYLERCYKYSPDASPPPSKDFFTRCNCKKCSSPDRCDCQDSSELMVNGRKMFAYDENGLFAFDRVGRGIEVIECNAGCRCTISCRNRVAQRPRDFPIEVFKTTNRGWGARSSVDIKAGRVLGTYTGLLLPRHKALAKPSEYQFDLDGHEDPNSEEDEIPRYTVDSTNYGNWTRFINHSCNPNLVTYLVVYDTLPGRGTPYVAFVASRDIKALEEFTFDYRPQDAEKIFVDQGPSQEVSDSEDDARVCRCGSKNCRGYY